MKSVVISKKHEVKSSGNRHIHRTLPKMQSTLRETTYDDQTGLVFDQFEVLGARGAARWITDFKTPNLVKKKIKPNETKGARTLREMALGKLGLESQELSPESLQSLPWTVGEKIWDRIRQNYAESFYIWRTFAVAYGREFADGSNRYFLDIKSPSMLLTDYYAGLNSSTFQWLTCLRLSPKQVNVPTLVSISSILSLSVLDLSDGQLYIENRESTFDLRVMRTWSELAKASRAFQKLRVLMLGWQEKVDSWIFDLLTAFPLLNIVVLTDCHNIHHKNHKEWEQLAWTYGWKFLPSKRGVKHLRSLLDDKAFQTGNVSNLYYESLRLTISDSDTSIKARPILECWLGTPRKWTHIIDEFPGTRTILFQKKSHGAVPPGTQQPIQNLSATARREPSSPKTSEDGKRIQGATTAKRKGLQRSATSLLTEMGYAPS